MAVPLGLITGAEVGMVEKKQGRFTFPESDPVTGLIIDNALDAERQKAKGFNAFSNHINTFTTVLFVNYLLIIVFLFFSPTQMHVQCFPSIN